MADQLEIVPVAGLVGYNISYSVSPILHEAAGEASSRRLDYQLFDVSPGHLEIFLKRLGELGDFCGLNVTMPHKEAVANILDAMHSSAREIGAVNTIAVRGEHLIGYNTDRPAIGAVLDAELRMRKLDPEGWTAVVLGSGGAARAVVWALLDKSIAKNIIVCARNAGKAHLLNNDAYTAYSRARVSFSRHPWIDWATLLVDPPAMLINTTPLTNVGFETQLSESGMLPSVDRLKQFSLVFDLVYNPPRTQLMRIAEENGIEAIGGGGVLIEQAVLSRAIWFGRGAEEIERMAMLAAYESWARRACGESKGGLEQC